MTCLPSPAAHTLRLPDAPERRSTPEDLGYRRLMVQGSRPHHTVIVADFPIDAADVLAATDHLGGLPTTLHVLRPAEQTLGQQLRARGVDLATEHVSTHVLHACNQTLKLAEALQDEAPYNDLCAIGLPRSDHHRPEAARRHALEMLRLVSRTDFAAQGHIADRFYALLERARPYTVQIETPGGRLVVEDDDRWFNIAGPLIDGDVRGLPGGEVAYAGREVSGSFVIDGALLASPLGHEPRTEALADQVNALSARIPSDPLTVVVERARVRSVTSRGPLARELMALLHRPVYQVVSEVGVAFNQAASRFIYDWAAPSNESRPGVHIALGGELDAERRTEEFAWGLLHVDLMAATTRVSVNGAPFIETWASA